jgi:hypothetical protein
MLKQKKRKSRLIPAEPARLNAEKRDATGGKASALSPTNDSKQAFLFFCR